MGINVRGRWKSEPLELLLAGREVLAAGDRHVREASFPSTGTPYCLLGRGLTTYRW